ncbi:hypothetical protein H310_02772 [Aphanomyces invadans]|uniref:PDZ domain-containing protein n=1 Tax=Aphanomyces invadans TaxID=157072 RepID=A0A024UK45_9STRA|nr:hypothetical protein H310_02772 [Aphanomyces invadans]ETW06545.1 hypothetical protein H310_02772 [Aphanomyces invadans]RHY30687.1 hypothetical protein DYB32_004107 [Aphanomyces invadans]|eukprot:XP_008864620.1 hypothetical protein H310_02772 [Aphanomyces invadans]
MGHSWSKQQPDDYYLGHNGGAAYGLGHLTGILSHDRRTDVVYSDVDDAPHTVTIGSRAGLPILVLDSDNGSKKNKPVDLPRRLGIVVRTSGSRLTKSATVVVTDFLRIVDGTKVVPRNKTWGTDPRNWQGVKGPAEASGGIRIGDTIHAINGSRLVNKSKRQVIKMLGECCASTRQQQRSSVVVTFRHGDIIPAVPWETEQCVDPPEGEFVETDHEWGCLAPLQMKDGSVSI